MIYATHPERDGIDLGQRSQLRHFFPCLFRVVNASTAAPVGKMIRKVGGSDTPEPLIARLEMRMLTSSWLVC